LKHFKFALCALFACSALAADELKQSFETPPASARPLTWWHWLDGNITREGITADLEAMKRAGLGGTYMFDAGMKMPDGPVRFMQPAWQEMLKHAISEADRLGLKFGVHNCDGFSQSGGPWITPETSMKELTWSAKDVDGGKVDVVLPKPKEHEGFYRDIAVVAFPIRQPQNLTGAKLSGSLPDEQLANLIDGKDQTTAAFPIPNDNHHVDFLFEKPVTVRSVKIRGFSPHNWEADFPIQLEVSDDGKNFHVVGTFTANWDFEGADSITAACDEAQGRVFRLSFKNPWPVKIAGIELSGTARVHFAEAKAVRIRSRGHGGETRHHLQYPGPDRNRTLAPNLVIPRDQVRNLTAQMDADGRLKCELPPGRWRILRAGFTSNGHYVGPAVAEGRGLECDKLDSAVVRSNLGEYVGKLVKLAGPAAGKTFGVMEIDSWECGIQNWTAGLEKRFRKEEGYDLIPFLPTLLEGWIVDNPDVSERALWDWRRFLADQLSKNFFAVAADYAHENNLTYVGESTGRQQPLYDVAYIKNSDIPMGEFWLDSGPGQGVRVDNKVASSIAHTTGKPVIASESYTGSPGAAAWQNHPFSMKPLGDRAFCAGVNQFVFHTFAHQPYQAPGPGFTFGQFGLNFNRGNTWWESAHAWTEYLTRCNELLRTGSPVADVLYFVGEDVPNRIGWREDLRPPLPTGYDFDGCDVGALLQARVKDGRIVLPSGTEYRMLLLPPLTTMSVPVIKKIHDLVTDDAVILGQRPAQSPSLSELGAGDDEVRKLADDLWGPTGSGSVDRVVGKGRVFAGISFGEVFKKLDLSPDFTCESPDVLYVHRRTGDADIYFLSNQKNSPEEFRAVFRTGNRAPELWDPATGNTRALPDFKQEPGRTTVPLRLDPFGSAFLVFRGDRSPAKGVNWSDPQVVETISGPWQVTFPPNLGAPASAKLDALASLAEHPDPGISHFSGTATYSKTGFSIPEKYLAKNRELFLDLDRVEVIAEVVLNGKNLGTLWKPPFRVCIDGIAKPDGNDLEIRVTNLWPNRMIGDASLPDDVEWRGGRGSFPAKWPDWLTSGKPRTSGRVTFCTRRDVYTKDDPLLPSGLIGPVTIQAAPPER